jgi:hypothetical protein
MSLDTACDSLDVGLPSSAQPTKTVSSQVGTARNGLATFNAPGLRRAGWRRRIEVATSKQPQAIDAVHVKMQPLPRDGNRTKGGMP